MRMLKFWRTEQEKVIYERKPQVICFCNNENLQLEHIIVLT